MLTKELLEVTKRKPKINPRYRDIDKYQSVATHVLDAYESGQTKKQIDETIETLETHDTFKLVRGLSKLLDRRAKFEQQFPVDPATLFLLMVLSPRQTNENKCLPLSEMNLN